MFYVTCNDISVIYIYICDGTDVQVDSLNDTKTNDIVNLTATFFSKYSSF